MFFPLGLVQDRLADPDGTGHDLLEFVHADFLKNNLFEKVLFPQKLTKRAIIP